MIPETKKMTLEQQLAEAQARYDAEVERRKALSKNPEFKAKLAAAQERLRQAEAAEAAAEKDERNIEREVLDAARVGGYFERGQERWHPDILRAIEKVAGVKLKDEALLAVKGNNTPLRDALRGIKARTLHASPRYMEARKAESSADRACWAAQRAFDECRNEVTVEGIDWRVRHAITDLKDKIKTAEERRAKRGSPQDKAAKLLATEVRRNLTRIADGLDDLKW